MELVLLIALYTAQISFSRLNAYGKLGDDKKSHYRREVEVPTHRFPFCICLCQQWTIERTVEYLKIEITILSN